MGNKKIERIAAGVTFEEALDLLKEEILKEKFQPGLFKEIVYEMKVFINKSEYGQELTVYLYKTKERGA